VQGRRRALEEGQDPPHVGLREGHREQSISWDEDQDFGYLIAGTCPASTTRSCCNPRLYEREGRMQEYADMVERLKAERVERLQEFRSSTTRS